MTVSKPDHNASDEVSNDSIYQEGYAKGNAGVHSAYCPHHYLFNEPLKKRWIQGWEAGRKDAGLNTKKRTLLIYICAAFFIAVIAYILYANLSILDSSPKTTILQTLEIEQTRSADSPTDTSLNDQFPFVTETNNIKPSTTTEQLLKALENKASQLAKTIDKTLETTSDESISKVTRSETTTAPTPPKTKQVTRPKNLSHHAKRFQFTSNIITREPINQLMTLSEPETIYFFSSIINFQGRAVYHNWYLNNQLITKKRFSIRGPRWRVYSADSFGPGTSGLLTVKILTEEGDLIAEKSLDIDIPIPNTESPTVVIQPTPDPPPTKSRQTPSN